MSYYYEKLQALPCKSNSDCHGYFFFFVKSNKKCMVAESASNILADYLVLLEIAQMLYFCIHLFYILEQADKHSTCGNK